MQPPRQREPTGVSNGWIERRTHRATLLTDNGEGGLVGEDVQWIC
jgi:hypothetical protein